MLKQHAAIEAEMRLQHDFADAMAAVDGSGMDLTRRAAMLGIRLDVPHEVMRANVSLSSSELADRDRSQLATAVRRNLAARGIDAVVSPIMSTDYVIVVMSETLSRNIVSTAATTARRTIREGVAALTRSHPDKVLVTIGIGTAGTGVDALRASHAGAVRALNVIKAKGGSGTDLRISDAGSFSLLTATATEDRQEFVDRYLRNLIDYDRTHGTDLIDTLQAYFTHVGNAQRTADAKYLHVSTVRYRLSRIEELAEVSLVDEEDRLALQLALRLKSMSEPGSGASQPARSG